MSDEATIRVGLSIRLGSTHYDPKPTVFRSDVSDPVRGPSPGFVLVPQGGVDIEFTDLTSPSLCRIANLEDAGNGNYVTYGIHDPQTGKFYPLGEVLPGEFYPLRLSRFLEGEYGTGTGSGTSGPSTNKLRLKAALGPAGVTLDAFDL